MTRAARQASIFDVARRADVSIATVSRGLNDRPAADTDMVRRVRAAANELAYRPSGTARNLVAQTPDSDHR